MSNQGNVQQSVIDRSGSAGNLGYNGEWLFLFDEEEVLPLDGTFNGRLLNWLNTELVAAEDPEAPYADLPGAMQAYAESLDFYNWSSMTAIGPGA